MSDLDILRRLRAIEERLGRIEVLEAAGGGAWTPAFAGSGGGGSFTYTVQSGAYVRMGGVVFAWFDLAINTFTSAPAGNLQISGLPITSATTGAAAAGAGAVGYKTAALTNVITLYVGSAATIIVPLDVGANVPASALAAGAELHGVVIYRV